MAVIVTRHAGLVTWLAQRGIVGEVLTHVPGPEQIEGQVVYGALPLHLAAYAKEIVTVDMPLLAAAQRGIDLTPEQMDEAGATMARYRVQRL